MYCPNCGKQNEDKNKFCLGCGERFPLPPAQAAAPAQREREPIQPAVRPVYSGADETPIRTQAAENTRRAEPAPEPPSILRYWPLGLVVLLIAAFLVGRLETGAPAATPVSTRTREKDGMLMVFVPAGPFTMGSDDINLDRPAHQVTLDSFWIDQTEVTNAMFTTFVGAKSYQTHAEKTGGSSVYNPSSRTWVVVKGADWQHPQGPGSSLSGLSEHPVVHVSWNDAVAYCAWAGARLPTEAEWEKAARGTDGRTYPWGEGHFFSRLLNTTKANFNLDAGGTTMVGQYESGASPYGALDMVGNVFEWVADWYDQSYYQNSPATNPSGPATGNFRVQRGGWEYSIDSMNSAYRGHQTPTTSVSLIGFRCAQSSTAEAAVTEVPRAAATLIFQQGSAPVATDTSVPTSNTNSTRTRKKDGMVEVYVPEGSFTMGSNKGYENEKPTHQVALDSFWIDQTEVTNEQFASFVQANNYQTEAEKDGKSFVLNMSTMSFEKVNGADWQHPQGPGSSLSGLSEHPVVHVSWNDAVAYCAWAGAHLPTEAEWEKAARGTDGRTYPWGEGIDKTKANYNQDVGSTTAVGSYPSGASPYGALEMAGNVWEWVDDFATYPGNSVFGSNNSTEYKLRRGGSWRKDGYDLRSTIRIGNSKTLSIGDGGFRCARLN